MASGLEHFIKRKRDVGKGRDVYRSWITLVPSRLLYPVMTSYVSQIAFFNTDSYYWYPSQNYDTLYNAKFIEESSS